MEAAISALKAEMVNMKERIDAEMEHMRHTIDEVDRRWSAILTERDTRFQERFVAQEKALDRSEVSDAQWRHAANEWRGAMDDREDRYAMRAEVETSAAALHKELDTLRSSAQAERDQIRKDLEVIRNELTLAGGRAAGMDKMWGYIIAAISAAGAVGVTIAFVTKGP